MGWMLLKPSKTGRTVSSLFTAIRKHYLDNRREWYKPLWMMTLLRGAKRFRPAKAHRKRPICHIFIHGFYNYAWDRTQLESWSGMMGALLGYWGGLRGGEYLKTTDGEPLRLRHVKFFPNKEHATEMILTIIDSKTNKYNQHQELVSVRCVCGHKRLGFDCPCPVHFLLDFLAFREGFFGRKPRVHDFVIISKFNVQLSMYKMNMFLKKGVRMVGKHYRTPIQPLRYSTHGLRHGGCTDMARLGIQSDKIQLWGRWRSECWKLIYVNLDLWDIARLHRLSLGQLREQIICNR